MQNTAETASEPSETSSATGPKSDDQEEDVGQGGIRARARVKTHNLECKFLRVPPARAGERD